MDFILNAMSDIQHRATAHTTFLPPTNHDPISVWGYQGKDFDK